MTLPGRTLTFMFTDIEGSTQLWEQHTEEMQAALARHDHLLQEAIAAHDGSIIKTTGDGWQAVFSSGLDAVQTALAIQRAIAAESWHQAIGHLRVRVALLTGTAEERDGDYYGPVVNRTARLTAAGHGGQILLSKTTQELVRDVLPAGTSALDLGKYHLKGVARPEHIYQLVAPDLPAEFPPLSAVSVQPTNLPRLQTPIIGRQQELEAVLDLLRGHQARLVTLTGQGGTGKTRLSLKVAETIMPDFPDGVFFVDLAPLTAPDRLPSAVANVLGIAEVGGRSLNELIQRHLMHRQLLLVLDNFEHLLAAADLLPGWLQSSPDLSLLVTSREALNLQEEWLYPVGGLSYPDIGARDDLEKYGAVQLFIQSARRVRPDFSLDGEAEGVIRICRMVEGLPLALELAASWTRTMDAQAIAGEIQRSTDFLATRMRNVPARHRSMLAAFDTSWQQLEPPEQTAFARLSVFRGGFDRAAAQAVAEAGLALLSTLVDKSLLRWLPSEAESVAGGRYQIHELLRQFGQEKLQEEAGELERIQRQHAIYFTDYVRDLLPLILDDRQLEATAKITADIENIRAAWLWAAEHVHAEALAKASHALSNYYQFKGRYTEGYTLFSKAAEALERVEQTPPIEKTLALIWLDLAYMQIRLGLLAQAKVIAERSAATFQRYDLRPEPGLGTDPRTVLGILASIEGDFEATAYFGEQIRHTSDADDNTGNRPFGAYLLTRAALAQGDYEAARRYAREGYAVGKETGERWFLAYSLNELGNVEFALGNYEAARDHYQAALAIRQEFDDPEGPALAAIQLGAVALREEKYAEAENRFRRALEIYEELNDRGGVARSRDGLGQTAATTGRLREACDHFLQGLGIAVDIQFMPATLSLLQGLGQLFLDLDEQEMGLQLLDRAATHPAGEYETRRRAKEALAGHQELVAGERHEAFIEAGSTADLMNLVTSAREICKRL